MQASPAAARSASGTVRGTQSLVHIIGACWRRPGLLLREVAWRWLFGLPTLGILYFVGKRLLALLLAGNTSLSSLSHEDPMASLSAVAASAAALEPLLLRVGLRVLPLLALVWAIASGIGRGYVVRALAPGSPIRSGRLIALQLIRIAALCATVAGWYASVRWAARATLYGGAEPNLVGYSALVICLSLGIFTLWALLSWIFSIAPLLSILEDRSVLDSLRASFRLGPLKGKLVEVNLVLGIVKLALLVLAMVFSATPLPFESVVQGSLLYVWWAFVSVLYLLASDFFQVARIAAFVEFWRSFRAPGGSAVAPRGV